MTRVLLGVTGSVAATLTPKLVGKLTDAGHEVRVMFTEASRYFFCLEELSVQVFGDMDEWPRCGYVKGDAVTHIVLRDWAEVLLIAPLTANTLAKIANGIGDNLVTSVMRAWQIGRPVIVAPAMNTQMWMNPFTQRHLATIGEIYGARVVEPVSKMLACGETGVGALADLQAILDMTRVVVRDA